MWRLAFFGRLEERKGIKLFVDAVDRLPSNITSRPDFEVVFMGSEVKIDQIPSGVWLDKKTAHWNFTTRVYMNMPGYDPALDIPKECAAALGACAQSPCAENALQMSIRRDNPLHTSIAS